MSSIGVIGSTETEIMYIKDKMNTLKEFSYAGIKFYSGTYNNLKIVIGVSGIGKVNAAMTAQILILKFEVEKLISLGIAGSLNQKIKVCDIVIAEKVTYHDIKKLQMATYWPCVEYFMSDEYMVDKAVEAYEKIQLKECNYHIGKVVTGDVFVADDELKYLIANENRADCVEMEGAAIAQVSHANNIPFIIVRSICNNADDRASMLYNELDCIGAHNVSKFVCLILEEIAQIS